MRVAIGSSPAFEASFVTLGGAPAPLLAPPVVTFFQNDVEIWTEIERVITDLGNGRWSAVITVPEDSEFGWAEIRWEAQTAVETVNGVEQFEVVAATSYISQTQMEQQLRRRLRDRLQDPTDDSGAFFPNDEIHTLLAVNGGNMMAAALDGWLIKMAHYQMFVDVDESGSSRKLNQVFKNAEAMVRFYQKAVDSENEGNAAAISGRVVGKVASLRGEYVDTFGLVTMWRAGIHPSFVYVRPFATKRLLTGI